MDEKGLTKKQQVFVHEYLKDFNATRAAKSAGYSDKTAGAIGTENLQKPLIKEAIKIGLNDRIMSEEEVKTRLADIARGNITDLMDVSTMGFTVNLTTTDEQGNRILKPEAKLIKKIKQKVTTYMAKNESGDDREIIETEIELYSAHEALRDIGKLHAMFTEKHEVSGKDGNPLSVTIYVPDNDRPRND